MNLQNNTAKAAIYARRSPEDRANRQNQFRGDGVSDSIESQELLCRGWSHHLIHMTAVHLWQNGTLQL